MKQKIWVALNNSKFKEIYIGYKIIELKKKNRNINIFLAIITIISVASWAKWDSLKYLWGGVILLTQIITLISPYFRIQDTIKELQSIYNLYSDLNLKYEKFWEDLDNGQLTERNAKEIFWQLRQTENKFNQISNEIVSENKSIYRKSYSDLKTYIKQNYNINETK